MNARLHRAITEASELRALYVLLFLALLQRLTDLETQRAQINTEIRELEALHIVKSPPLTRDQIVALSKTMQEKLTLSLPEQIRTILLDFVHEIRVRKNDQDQIEGTITYYLPSGASPPFSTPLPDSPGTGYNLPTDQAPLGAPPYRQTFTHPIVCPPKRPR